jgi:hypothetical protein
LAQKGSFLAKKRAKSGDFGYCFVHNAKMQVIDNKLVPHNRAVEMSPPQGWGGGHKR